MFYAVGQLISCLGQLECSSQPSMTPLGLGLLGLSFGLRHWLGLKAPNVNESHNSLVKGSFLDMEL